MQEDSQPMNINSEGEGAEDSAPPSKSRSIREKYFSEKRLLSGANIFQVLFFAWVSPLLTYGYRFDIEEKAIPHLREQDKPKVEFNKLSFSYASVKPCKMKGWRLVKSILKAYKKEIGLVLCFTLVSTTLLMYSPILTHNIIAFISQKDRSMQLGICYFLQIFFLKIMMTLSQTFLYYYFAILGFNLSNTLSLLIYDKALRHPLITEKQFSVSDIINLSQVDSQRMTNMGFQMAACLFAPLQLIVGLILLYSYIGPVSMVGLGVMFLLMLFTMWFVKVAAGANDKLLKAKDGRLKVTEQIMQIIRFIKINALEKFFFHKLNRKREAELKLTKKVNLCYVAVIFVYFLASPLIVSFTFIAFVYIGGQITAAKAFLTIIIFNILQSPIRQFPISISNLIQIWSSLKRIENFLDSKEIDAGHFQIREKQGQRYAIEIEDGYFMWGKSPEDEKKKEAVAEPISPVRKSSNRLHESEDDSPSPTRKASSTSNIDSDNYDDSSSMSHDSDLRESLISAYSMLHKQKETHVKVLKSINIKFPSSKVTMIIGDIGSGKSSLLYAILNEMTPDATWNPKVTINGSIAYCPQKPWIMSGTLRDNIVFHEELDEIKLQQVLKYACLQDDIKILGKGLDTEIGEKGTNLSGGQKARVSLARALYSNRDIYLLDDILSAVDVHVGKFLMQETISKFLTGKTVIMPTHAINHLQKASNIVIMKKGRIAAQGTFEQLKQEQTFRQIIKIEKRKQKKKEKQEKQEKSNKEEEETIIKDQIKVHQATVQMHHQSSNPTDQLVEQLIMPEDRRKGKLGKEVYLEYLKLNGGVPFLLSTLFCMVVWAVLSIMSNVQIKTWCEDENKSQIYLHLYLGFAIIASMFSGIRALILVVSGIRQGRLVHKKMIKSLLYASIPKFYNRVPIGRILNRLSKDLREVDQSIGYSVGTFLVNLFTLVASLSMCIYASSLWVLIPIVLVTLLCLKFKDYYLKSQRQCIRLQNITTSPIVSGFTSMVNGVATIRAYGLNQQFLYSQMERIDVNKRLRITREALQSWFAQRLSLFSFLISMSAMAFCILGHSGSASLAGLLLTYSMSINEDIINSTFSYAQMETKMIAIERVSAFTKIQPQPGYQEYCKIWRTKEESSDLEAISKGDIQFKHYGARYRDGLDLVVRDIDMEIKSGEKVGIVGRTGAGKSTLINCLLRILQPATGDILIDGKSLTDYNLKDLRSCMTMIDQEPTLINGTIRENLDFQNKFSDETIMSVLRQCHLDEMVQEKGGIDGKVTNETLSAGEKQLLCICRALLKNSRIILIDEATANIDVRNDRLIHEVIATKFKESTVLTIAHRLSTLKDADKILVLGEGKVVQWGLTVDLMNQPNSTFRKMCQRNDNSYLS